MRERVPVNCRKISENFSSTGVTSPFVARKIPTDGGRRSCRSAGERSTRLPAREGKSRLRQGFRLRRDYDVTSRRGRQRSEIRKFLCRWEAAVELGTSSP